MTDYGLNDTISISFWFKPNDTKGGLVYFTNPVSYGVYFSEGKIGFNTLSGDLYGARIDTNSYQHIIAILSSNPYLNKLYINGVQQTLIDFENRGLNGSKLDLSSKQIIRISGTGNTALRENLNNSIIDDLHLWNREISDKEIEALYLQQKNAKNRVDFVNKMKVKITFDNDKIENEINNKVYSTEGKGVYAPTTHKKGFKFLGDQFNIPISDIGSIDDEWITFNFYFKFDKNDTYMRPISIGEYTLYINKVELSDSSIRYNMCFNTYNSDIYGIDYT